VERGIDFEALLTELARAEVEFIVIGGVCGVLHGSSMMTNDLDIVFARGKENRERLVRVLHGVEASYRDTRPDRLVPTEYDLASPLPHLLMTRFGRLDLLGSAHGGLTYEDLFRRTILVSLDSGVKVRILDLRGLIEMKETANRDKDKLHVMHLRHVLEERRKRGEEL
jgi:predicted nucleotidyltransferase